MHPRPCAASLGRDQGPAAHPKKVSLLRDAVLLCVHVLGFIPGLYDIVGYKLPSFPHAPETLRRLPRT